MHWDLRIEIDGVLVSWAVPKGPSTDPSEKRLAVQTEDHPLDYADFEGVIPKGSYGAGPMIIWDHGTFHSHENDSLALSLQRGKLDLEFFGHKLCGRWGLVRLKKSDSGKEWLLIKKQDSFAAPGEITQKQPASVVSGLTLEERRDPELRQQQLQQSAWSAGGLGASLQRQDLAPMLAKSATSAFDDPQWIFEIKYDGVRACLARTTDGHRHLLSRQDNDYRLRFPEIALAARYLPAPTFAVDGEIIAVDESGGGSFELLQQRLGGGSSTVRAVMYAFDLTHLAGYDLRQLPLLQRKQLLREFLPPTGPLRYTDHITGDGARFFDLAKQRGIEGVLAKQANSVYQSGQRSDAWLKIKAPRAATLAVVGWMPGRGGRKLGSLLLAWLIDGTLRYAGNVGSGISERVSTELMQTFANRSLTAPAFESGDLDVDRSAVFVSPTHTARVRYTEVTSAGALRHPVFLGLDETHQWHECSAPASLGTGTDDLDGASGDGRDVATTADVERAVRRTNIGKIFWPAQGYTKGDLLNYYESIWPYLHPYLRDRPVVLTRYPDGIDGKSFFQKHAPEFTPDWVSTRRIDDTEYIVADNLETLLYIINLGCIPLHLWSARCSNLEEPDWCVLDLDPKGAPFGTVVEIARHLHRMLDEFDVAHFAKTSGQAGVHILIPLADGIDHLQAKMFGEIIARLAARELEEIATIARPLSERADRVYIDFLQNGYGKTIAAPLCVRPVDGATVSMPLRWSQVAKRLNPGRYTIKTVPKLLEKSEDPMAPLLSDSAGLTAQTLNETLEHAHNRLTHG